MTIKYYGKCDVKGREHKLSDFTSEQIPGMTMHRTVCRYCRKNVNELMG